MLSPLEMKRFQEIDRRLTDIRARREKFTQVADRARGVSRRLADEAAALEQELEDLEQGQLLLEVDQSA